jgi:heme/copper-type cytochrome/quinol oxidase subunit 2
MNSRLAAGLLLATLVLALAPAASAQCAMCANAAASQQAEARKALNMGIAALVAPVFLLIGGFVFLSYQRRNAPDDPSGELPELAEPAPLQTPVVHLPLDSPPDRSRPSP